MSASISARVGEILPLMFDFRRKLQFYRYPGLEYELGDYITIGAFVYECTSAGVTAPSDLEEVATVIGAVFNDGSVEWTCRDFSAAGGDTISSYSLTAASGITIDSDAVEKDTRVICLATLTAAGTLELSCSVETAGGAKLIEALQLVVTD